MAPSRSVAGSALLLAGAALALASPASAHCEDQRWLDSNTVTLAVDTLRGAGPPQVHWTVDALQDHVYGACDPGPLPLP